MAKLAYDSKNAVNSKRVVLCGSTSFYVYKFRKNTIKRLIANGHEVVCVAPEDEYSQKLQTELGAAFTNWQLELTGANVIRELSSLISIFKILRRARPGFVFNFGAKPNIYAGIACRVLGIAYSNNVSGLGMKIGTRSLLARLMAYLYGISNKGANTVFIQNPDDLAFLQEHRLVKEGTVSRLWGSGVDLNEFTPSPLPTEGFCFALIARMQGDKGVYEYVDAAKIIKRRYPKTSFLLVGPTAFTNQTKVSRNTLENWRQQGIVDIADMVEDVRSVLKKAHVVVLPSHGGEGIPRILLEAAACGRPSIVSDVPGCRHAVIDGKTGLVCKPRDAESLADAMEQMITMPIEKLDQMGNAARNLAESKFSEEHVIDAYLNCLNPAAR